MSEVVIREAIADDLPDIIALSETVAAEGRWIGMQSPIDIQRVTDRFLTHVAGSTYLSLVAVSVEVVVGQLQIAVTPYGVADLGMMLAAGYRGQGLGRSALRSRDRLGHRATRRTQARAAGLAAQRGRDRVVSQCRVRAGGLPPPSLPTSERRDLGRHHHGPPVALTAGPEVSDLSVGPLPWDRDRVAICATDQRHSRGAPAVSGDRDSCTSTPPRSAWRAAASPTRYRGLIDRGRRPASTSSGVSRRRATRGHAVARLIGADAADIALIPSVSSAAGLVAAQFGPAEPGQNVVIGEREYSSNHFPWRQLAHKGYDVRQVPFRNGGLEPDDVAE